MHRLRETKCPNNIFGLITSYITDRAVTLSHAGARVTKGMSKGCIQGSTCGPILWNLILDELLDKTLPPGCHLQAYADDVLLVATAADEHTLTQNTNQALGIIADWGRSVKLTFGAPKTQAIAFTPRAKSAGLVMDGHRIVFGREIKVLGVIIDEKLTFHKHIQYVIEKTRKIFNKLCLYIKPTWGAHTDNVKTIYKHVIEPIVTYAAGIWGQAALKKVNSKLLLSMQRGFALKAIRAFRTVSTTAALALAQFTPLDLKIQEIYTLERTRLTGTTPYLPDDIGLETPTPPHLLLHPSDRISITCTSPPGRESTHTYTDTDTNTDTETHTQQQCNTYHHIYTDGSKQDDGRVGAAFVCFDPGGKVIATRKIKLHGCCTVFQAELLAIQHACRWVLDHRYNQTYIHSDSQSALLSLKIRSNTHPIVTHIHRMVHEYQKIGTINFSWVKGHAGIAGNEMADGAAREACNLHKSPDYCRFPLSYAKGLARGSSREAWQARYDQAEQGRRTWALLPSLEQIRELWRKTNPTFNFTQFLTGHGYHRAYLHRFKITSTDTCVCDNNSTQTIEHLMRHCNIFMSDRHRHEAICDRYDVDPYNLNSILRTNSTIESFLELIDNIFGRIKDINTRNTHGNNDTQ
ncbi:hypothetical protein O3G_MSEX012296 [Manduca sexta]|uniref:Uncharacterized protein n=1 Tax=Manduca sexta TaxID=7130 RepID=A0A922CWS1_MANSE|nr:hypothetical protein O3G_MSEX012296 [Manduca sexta]